MFRRIVIDITICVEISLCIGLMFDLYTLVYSDNISSRYEIVETIIGDVCFPIFNLFKYLGFLTLFAYQC